MSTNGTTCATPLFKTCTVKDVLTENREEARCIVHSFEADRTGRKFDEIGSGRRERFNVILYRSWCKRIVG